MATNYDNYTKTGLSNAQGLMGSTGYAAYPNAPQQYQYYNYSPNQPMAQINAPDYKGLMGQDYDKLQQALTQPGAAAATTAYQQGYTNLNNVMGGNGLYGSSIMANQANNNLDRTYQQALANNAANAVAQRYTMQQQDLSDYNKFNSQNYATGIDQNKALYQANANDADRYNQYQAGLLNWNNTNANARYQYDLAKATYGNAGNEAKINQWLSLAGYGSPLATAAQQYKAAQNSASQMSDAANTSAWLGAAGSLAGGLLNSNINWSGLGSGISDAYYGIGNWLDGY